MRMTMIELSASEAVKKIGAGEITSEELVQAYLDRIDQVEGEIGAWTHLDPGYALEQACARDAQRRAGRALGPLHGIPIGIKDIIDTSDYPCELGSPLYAGRRPFEDAAVVARLRAAGAVIMGKTVTTEFAVFSPGKTTNPHDATRTPGGSSSGSAAAVASFMVPGAFGSQTNGSVIRPASFCGVYGFKPTHGLISRAGVLQLSYALDHLGVFARSLEDAALFSEAAMGFDPMDKATAPRARPALLDVLAQEPPVPPNLAFVKTPVWDKADTSTQEAFAELADALGGRVEEVELPAEFNLAHAWQKTIMNTDMAKNLAGEYELGRSKMSDVLAAMIEDGQNQRAVDYAIALDGQARLSGLLDDLFGTYDAIITPATVGEAPVGLDATGDPTFNTIWTYTGVPAVTLPLLQGGDGMPLGVQLVAGRGDDARLLRTARWLCGYLQAE